MILQLKEISSPTYSETTALTQESNSLLTHLSNIYGVNLWLKCLSSGLYIWEEFEASQGPVKHIT